MTFNSIGFLAFFIIVFFLYYFPLKENTKAQNWLLLLSSYFFYGLVDWKVIPLLLTATIVVFIIGRAIQKSQSPRISSLFSVIGVLTGVGLLLYFKYFNFFIDSFSSVLNAIGLQSNLGTFNIIMPLGISFFTFKLISYIVEVQRGNIDHCRDFIAFSTYISFFPTILSGPIDKPNIFIPQLHKKRIFNYNLAIDGCRQILWGLFQKVVIADNLAAVVNNCWSDIPNQEGSALVIVALLYSVQIYTDFSGYSHMAIGIGKLLGFRITTNFNYPFFSRTIPEFWRKWHISLTSWVTGYIFTPLNIKFRNLGNLGIILAIIVNMIIVGVWHGANWTFVVFGLYNGLLFIPLILSGALFKKKKLKTNSYGFPSLMDSFRIFRTFLLISFGCIVFKAESVGQAYIYLKGIMSTSFFSIPNNLNLPMIPLIFSILFFMIEWHSREDEYGIAKLGVKWKAPLRYTMYYAIIISIFWFSGKEQQYIYFQF